MAHTSPQPPGPLTIAEYEALEAATGVKHEYVLGQVYALAGAAENHNRIALNIAAALLPAARAVGCRVVGSDQKLQAGDSLFYYPDVQVLCDATDNDPVIKRRPCVVVEVTSDSTESIDRREKLLAYRGIANLTVYLIVAQDRRDVTVHTRESGGSWQTHRVHDDDAIDLGCLRARLSVRAVYEDVLP